MKRLLGLAVLIVLVITAFSCASRGHRGWENWILPRLYRRLMWITAIRWRSDYPVGICSTAIWGKESRVRGG